MANPCSRPVDVSGNDGGWCLLNASGSLPEDPMSPTVGTSRDDKEWMDISQKPAAEGTASAVPICTLVTPGAAAALAQYTPPPSEVAGTNERVPRIITRLGQMLQQYGIPWDEMTCEERTALLNRVYTSFIEFQRKHHMNPRLQIHDPRAFVCERIYCQRASGQNLSKVVVTSRGPQSPLTSFSPSSSEGDEIRPRTLDVSQLHDGPTDVDPSSESPRQWQDAVAAIARFLLQTPSSQTPHDDTAELRALTAMPRPPVRQKGVPYPPPKPYFSQGQPGGHGQTTHSGRRWDIYSVRTMS